MRRALSPGYESAASSRERRRNGCRSGLYRGWLALVVVALAFGSLFAAPAYATFELVGTFGEGGPSGAKAEEGIGPTGGPIAVYYATGDVYVADQANNRVLRYDAHGRFLEAWGWGVSDYKQQFERCGPDGETNAKGEYVSCKGQEKGTALSGEGVGELNSPNGIAVDQATGEVFVDAGHKTGTIQVFSSDGQPLRSFGEVGNSTPEQLEGPHALAISESGNAYVVDNNDNNFAEQKVVLFDREPSGSYSYAGEVLHASLWVIEDIALDRQDNVYLESNGGPEGEGVYKFAAGDSSVPTWGKPDPGGSGMTVDPASGDVFYFNPSPRAKVHVLDPATGAEVEAFPAVKEQPEMTGLAFNPDLSWSQGRTSGTLYGTEKRFGEVFTQPPPAIPPRVDGESVANVGSTSALLTASVSPQGYQTTYRFQYGAEDCATHTCAEAPMGGGELGTGIADLVASESISGLQPETTYHYRVLASNQFGTVEGADQTFTTYPHVSAGLPDGRVYELVSPAFKDGGEVFPVRAEGNGGGQVCSECTPGENSVSSTMQVAPDGNSVVYEGFPFAASGVTVGYNEYLSKRAGNGWQTVDLSPERESPEGGHYPEFSSDLSQGVLWQPASGGALSSEAPAGYADLYSQGTGDAGLLRPLVAFEPPNGHAFALRFAAGSADFSHLVFEANDALTQERPGVAPAAQYVGSETKNLYEWIGGRLRLVNVLPGGGTASDPKAALGAGEALKSATEGGPDYSQAVSADGSRIFWSDEKSGQVYVRENGETTVEIPDPGRFLTASADGSRVLLNDGHIYDLQSGSTTDLTDGQGGFQGIAGASEDLSHVYFVDTGRLTEQQNSQGAVAQSGADNLYEYDASGSGTPVFVATLAGSDDTNDSNLTGDWTASPSDRTAQASADGRYLVFVSTLELTHYDSKTVGGSPVFEVFRYDSGDGALACVSCGLNGVRPTGDSSLSLVRPFGYGIYPHPRDVLADGRVFFNSRSSLSPYDVNGGVQDVYEYEPAGVGSCERQAGCTFLISRGIGTRDSEFAGASESGSDVFFTTRDQLVPADQDGLEDMYDARVGGGFEEPTPPACTGTGCQGVPGAPPIFATPSSVTFAGVGNFESTATSAVGKPKPKSKSKRKTVRCAKGRKPVRRKCVKGKRAKRAGRRR